MLRSSEAGCSCWEVRSIVISFEPDGGKINNHDLISHFVGFPAQNVVDFDISVGDVVVMHVFDSVAQFNEYDSHDISETACFVLFAQVVDYFLVSAVTFIELVPIHELTQST